jgi:Zn-dependent peptidase ImmA (M78 family)
LVGAKARGNVGGRKQTITDAQVLEALMRHQEGEEVAVLAKEFGVSRQGLYRRINIMLREKAK